MVLVVHSITWARAVTGGYIGVDVFFVISGYLISGHILPEIHAGRFSLVDFYERRVRRIFPALLVMLLITSILAWKFLLPAETENFAQSLIAALLSVSNFLFWSQAGYFDAPSAFKPLLHTWSLGVEEQFYIFFPLFILLVRRRLPRQLKPAILIAAAVSFLLACLWVFRSPTTAFFWSPSACVGIPDRDSRLTGRSTQAPLLVAEKSRGHRRTPAECCAGFPLHGAYALSRARGPSGVRGDGSSHRRR